jgi:toxin CcdB
MARFDVHPMPGGRAGALLDVQADVLEHLRTRVVVPLVPLAQAPISIRDLNPVFDIGGVAHVMQTQALAAIPVRELRPATGTMVREADAILRALDLLLTGI